MVAYVTVLLNLLFSQGVFLSTFTPQQSESIPPKFSSFLLFSDHSEIMFEGSYGVIHNQTIIITKALAGTPMGINSKQA